jgi:hypothetical protein
MRLMQIKDVDRDPDKVKSKSYGKENCEDPAYRSGPDDREALSKRRSHSECKKTSWPLLDCEPLTAHSTDCGSK